MVAGDEFQSQPCKTIHYINGEKLEGWRCRELHKSVGTLSIWVRRVGLGHQVKFVPTHNQKMGCGDHFGAHSPISTLSNHSLYLLIMRDWMGLADMKWLIQSLHAQSWCET